jgi:signal transduction histidine kinase
VPSTELGGGRLRAVLEQLAATCSLPASITIEADTAAGVHEETALYYVGMEALTNAVKHAEATSVDISLSRVEDTLVLSVRDAGVGGADPSGSGLQGLADRLAICGGQLQVRSAPGAGTTVTARIPLTRSSSTA